MTRRGIGAAGLALAGLLVLGGTTRAGGIGNAMIYGPYTGGHGYSYAEAYSYQLPFTANGFSSPWVYPYDWSSIPYRGYHFPQRPFHAYVNPDGEPTPILDEPPSGVPVAAGPAAPVVLVVAVPDGAELWFDGNKTAQAGPERTFYSPPLPGGQAYHYAVRARWTRDGKATEQVQLVTVHPGQQARVRFPQP
jgi:uncharacterized protein (TIGR03000 family)